MVVTQRIESLFTGRPATIFGHPCTAGTYLDELKNIATLLCYLSTKDRRPQADETWLDDIIREHEERSEHARPRWSLTPPKRAATRAGLLTLSDRILSAPTAQDAAAILDPWLARIPAHTRQRRNWLLERSRFSQTVSTIFTATLSTNRRLGHLLDDHGTILLETKNIPQQIPANIYRTHLKPALTTSDTIGRAFASLTIARRHPLILTWAQAGEAIGIPPEHALRITRAAQARTKATPKEINDIVDHIVVELDTTTHWRNREQNIRTLALDPDIWLRPWSQVHLPKMHDTSWQYALTWRWINEANGLPETSPAWTNPPNAKQRAAFRSFERRVNAQASDPPGNTPNKREWISANNDWDCCTSR